ncbi:MAG: hypothetical protein EOO05_17625 [Chitinophagaceae bacterium]|nr:MAG: hypothetical protein EOO05_17625 [Chitinophagaceae bacterium]
MKTTALLLAFGLLCTGATPAHRDNRGRPSAHSDGYQPDAGTLGRLHEGEEMTVYFSSFGCFSRSGKKLVFTRTGDAVRLTVFDGLVSYGKDGMHPSLEQGKLLKEKTMSDADMAIVAAFEKEMTKRRDGGCTTSETYTMVSGYKTISVTDASCQWFGMNQLMSDLFGKVF